MNIIGQIDTSAFASGPRMHHGEDEVALEFPSSVSSRRRNLLALKAQNWGAAATPPCPTWEWIDGYSLTYSRQQVVDADWSILDAYLPMTSGGTITWRWARSGVAAGRAILAYDANQVAKDYWANNLPSGQRTVSMRNYPTFVLFRFCCITVDKDYCFVRDDTAGEYLYKGALVP